MDPTGDLLGTRLRHLLELLDGDLAALYPELGLDGWRPRYTPFVRALVRLGPSSIHDLARAVSVTHSAASQTVAQMHRQGLVRLAKGADARQRIVHLTERTRVLLPKLDIEWAAASAAVADLDAELPYPLSDVVDAALRALRRRPMRDRIAARLAAG
ncbi:Winged helix DNA-binding domain-containing protein [Amycolatopsis arida]|uniref:Winged helix DNA-binding domain-containing protein n=1 Tax=Amycolatopsis arida TaxID=587909 RepID=A0A1I5ZF31_9PSEU|nr:MarR family transcriptional regulator [Amycolatopsis arida]TDX89609.1 winged helix DNA-binding protein [Amycolatopsis arida]SFQ55045.1 Winged helix DNA-binding domain-containing protein [Amycolatopsis arida]